MRQHTAFVFFLPAFIHGLMQRRAVSADDASPLTPAQPASAPTSPAPAETLSVDPEILDLRDVQANNAIPTHPAAPAITTITAASSTTGLPWGIQSEYTTTQWVETWINSTSRTWVPKTITLHFPSMSPAPAPGKGEIGMGTLASGGVGQTEVIVEGAAPTQGVGWGVGVGVVVGVVGAVV